MSNFKAFQEHVGGTELRVAPNAVVLIDPSQMQGSRLHKVTGPWIGVVGEPSAVAGELGGFVKARGRILRAESTSPAKDGEISVLWFNPDHVVMAQYLSTNVRVYFVGGLVVEVLDTEYDFRN